MKKITLYIVCVLMIVAFGCQTKDIVNHSNERLQFLEDPIQPDEFVRAGTREFQKKEKTLQLSLDEAQKIRDNYLRNKKKNGIEKTNKNIESIYKDLEKSKESTNSKKNKESDFQEPVLIYLYKNWYLFSPWKTKLGYLHLNGIWVNGNTGELHEVDKDIKVRIMD